MRGRTWVLTLVACVVWVLGALALMQHSTPVVKILVCGAGCFIICALWVFGLWGVAQPPAQRPYRGDYEDRYEREQRAYYERRAEDARMRDLTNRDSDQAPPSDWYR